MREIDLRDLIILSLPIVEIHRDLYEMAMKILDKCARPLSGDEADRKRCCSQKMKK